MHGIALHLLQLPQAKKLTELVLCHMQTYSSMTPAPVSVNWSQHLSEEGSLRQLASLRVLLSTFSGIPGVVGLHGGLPAADAFPFTEMSFTLRDGSKVVVNDPVQVSCPGQQMRPGRQSLTPQSPGLLRSS